MAHANARMMGEDWRKQWRNGWSCCIILPTSRDAAFRRRALDQPPLAMLLLPDQEGPLTRLPDTPARLWIARGFSFVEDLVYIGLGLLLAGSALVLLAGTGWSFGQSLLAGQFTANIIRLLDQILLILLVVELLYTVQVSFREHAVVPEPFLLVGLIAAIRRVLILTAEFGHPGTKTELVLQHFLLELGVLTFLIVALAVSLFVLRHRDTVSEAPRA